MPMLRQILIPLLCGLVFGIGLALSGMTDTQVVLGFLDIAGDWNPALLMVMIGARAVTVPGCWLAQKRRTPPVLQTVWSLALATVPQRASVSRTALP